MKENYGFFIIAILIWSVLVYLFSFIIILEPTVILGVFKIYEPDVPLFIISMVFLAINLIIFAIGYINYKLDEKPYTILYVLNSCPLILALTFLTQGNLFYLSFIFVPIILNTIFLGILAIGSEGRLQAFDLKPKEIMKYILLVGAYYLIIGFIIFLYWVMGSSTCTPFTFAILFYALNFIILIPLY
ncbi:MAG: hypothetical protein ACTSRG_03660 [Candidatus Helarchaeota archaeon]